MANSERKRRSRGGAAQIRVHFRGAARTVTGSFHFFEVTTREKTVLFFCDFGLDQEEPSRNYQNRLPSGIRWPDVSFGVVSHLHVDHIGAIPLAVKNGFKGNIYCTKVTCEGAAVQLPDCGYLQEEEAKRLSRKNERRCAEAASNDRKARGCGEGQSQTVQPLYTIAEATASLSHFKPVEFDTLHKVTDNIAIRFSHNPHILGAGIVTLEIGTGGSKRRIVFSGDLGRPGMPIGKELATIKNADYLICEGTYGNRKHIKRDRLAALTDIINSAHARALESVGSRFGAGAIVIPAFAFGRVQAVLNDLRELMSTKRIPEMPVFLDSPMAIKATAIYRRHPELFNIKAAKEVAAGVDLFSPPRYAELEDWKQSVTLDAPAKEPFIVVGSSGMAQGGRIMRHLENRLPGKQNTVVFIGYQGQGTLGRHLTTPGVAEARFGANTVPVRATIEQMDDYSGHADYEDIVRWLRGFQQRPRKTFLVHGDEEALTALQQYIERVLGWDVEVPRQRQYVDLD